MNNIAPPQRYQKGLTLMTTNSVIDLGDSPYEHVIKRLQVFAIEERNHGWDLVFEVEAEVVSVDGRGSDTGYLDIPKEIYRIPFLYESNLRKAILRSVMNRENWHKEGFAY